MAGADYESSPQQAVTEEEHPLLDIKIDDHFQKLFSKKSPRCSIFRMPSRLQENNTKAYEPNMISIGPYHREKAHLKTMEDHKVHYLQNLLKRRPEDKNSVSRYVKALTHVEEAARECYQGPIGQHVADKQEFIEMMILDGFFVVELLRKSYEIKKTGKKSNFIVIDCICSNFSMSGLTRDLLVLDNQLPLSVLSKLFEMTLTPQEQESHLDFIQMALYCFSDVLPGAGLRYPDPHHKCIKSLIERLKELFFSSKNPDSENHNHPERDYTTLLDLVHHLWLPSPEVIKLYSKHEAAKWIPIRNAMELQEAGIDFKGIEESSMFDITFKRSKLWMPTIKIEEDTDSILRNLIAYEQCHHDASYRYVTDYITFIDCLINSEKDATLLCRAGVIQNCLGCDDAVTRVIGNIGESILQFEDNFYAAVFGNVRKHCGRRCNVWLANLWNEYFSTPWTFIKFLAAFILLALTVLQTAYTVLPYYHVRMYA